jgi:hypothetical protein
MELEQRGFGGGRGAAPSSRPNIRRMETEGQEYADEEWQRLKAGYSRPIAHAIRLLESAATEFEAEAGLDRDAKRLRSIAEALHEIAGAVAEWRFDRDKPNGGRV